MASTSTAVTVPFLDLKAQYHRIKPEIDAAIAKILESSQFVLGEEVAGFEREFAAYSGAAQGIAVNSGTSALHLAFLAAGIGPGDQVITIPHTFLATVAAIGYTGARAVLRGRRSGDLHHGPREGRGGHHPPDPDAAGDRRAFPPACVSARH